MQLKAYEGLKKIILLRLLKRLAALTLRSREKERRSERRSLMLCVILVVATVATGQKSTSRILFSKKNPSCENFIKRYILTFAENPITLSNFKRPSKILISNTL